MPRLTIFKTQDIFYFRIDSLSHDTVEGSTAVSREARLESVKLDLMMIMRIWLLPIMTVICMCHHTTAQNQTGYQVLVTHENDFLAAGNKDENYTGGLKLDFLTSAIGLRNCLLLRLPGNPINVSRIAIGGTGYTPQILNSPDVMTGDRPYASLMYASLGRTSYSPDDRIMLSSEIIFGLMGADGPGNFQAWIHRNEIGGTGRPVPEGWHNQIAYRNSFVINYNTRLQYHLFGTSGSDRFDPVQVSAVGDAHLGTYMINLQAGLRINFVNVNATRLLNYTTGIPTFNAQGERVQPEPVVEASSGEKEHCRPAIRFNLFAEPIVRFAGYNATLEGSMFNDNSVYKIAHGDVKRLLFELNAGANMVICNFLYVKYLYAFRTQEFTGGKRQHHWGGITIGFSPTRWYKSSEN